MRYFVFIFLFVTLFSCKTKVPVFEIYQEVRFTIPAGKDYLATHHFLIKDIPSQLKGVLKEKSINLDDINELYAGRGRFESIVYESNYGVIDKISVWIYKKGDSDNALEIYYHDRIPDSRRGELKLLSTGQDVRDVLSSDEYEIDIEVQFKGFTTETIESRFIFSFVAYAE